MKVIPLAQLPPNGCAVVYKILAMGFLRERLFDMGIVVGTRVVCERSVPSGSGGIYVVRSARIAMRYCDGKQVLVAVS